MTPDDCALRPARAEDFADFLRIYRAILEAGETYPNPTDQPDAVTYEAWFERTTLTCMAEQSGKLVGAYKILPNQPGRGAHIANASYIVDPALHGRGIGRWMVEHSMENARRAGFRAMQFNYVISSNGGAIRLYESLGFRVLARLPEAFDHATLGLVDALVMHRRL